MLARRKNYDGLLCKGPIESSTQHLKVHECYPQLHLYSKDDYMRVNDIVAMHIVRTLQKRPHIRISMGVMKLVEEYGSGSFNFPPFHTSKFKDSPWSHTNFLGTQWTRWSC